MSVYVLLIGSESACVICSVAVHLNAEKVAPVIITNSKKDKSECVSGIYLLETRKGWYTRIVIRKWVD